MYSLQNYYTESRIQTPEGEELKVQGPVVQN